MSDEGLKDPLNIEGAGAINSAGIPQQISAASFDVPPKNAGKPSTSDTVLLNKSHISPDSPRALREAAENSLDKPIDIDPDHANPLLAESRHISQLVHLATEGKHFFERISLKEKDNKNNKEQ